MPVSKYRDFFINENEFESFKDYSFQFVSQCGSLYNSLMAQGMNEEGAKQVVYEKMYQPFIRAKGFYEKVKKGQNKYN